MADNVLITPGAGATVATDDVGGAHYQRVKVDIGGDGLSVPLPGDAGNGIDVDVTRVQGNVGVINGSTPFSVAISGSTTIADGGGSITVDVAALPLPAGAATEATLDLAQNDILLIRQATNTDRLLAASPFANRLSDGSAFYDATKTGQLPAALVSGRLDVNVGNEASANVTKIAGVAISAAAAGIQKVGITDETGTAYSHANPIQSSLVPQSESGQWHRAAAFTASLTGQTIMSPSGGKSLRVLGVIITVTGTGSLKIFDGTDSSANMLYQGTPPVGACIVVPFSTPWASNASNTDLKYTTGSGATGDITAYGYEI